MTELVRIDANASGRRNFEGLAPILAGVADDQRHEECRGGGVAHEGRYRRHRHHDDRQKDRRDSGRPDRRCSVRRSPPRRSGSGPPTSRADPGSSSPCRCRTRRRPCRPAAILSTITASMTPNATTSAGTRSHANSKTAKARMVRQMAMSGVICFPLLAAATVCRDAYQVPRRHNVAAKLKFRVAQTSVDRLDLRLHRAAAISRVLRRRSGRSGSGRLL